MRHTRVSGYTLFELVVVIGVLSVVTSIGVTSFYKMTSYWSAVQRKSQLHRTADNAFNAIQTDLAAVVASPLASLGVQGLNGEAQADELFYRIPLANDQLTAVIQAPAGESNRALSQRVTYRLDRAPETGIGTLVRAASERTAEPSEEQKTDVLAGVLQLDIQYAAAGGGGWQSEWKQPGLPAAVLVSLTVTDPNSPMSEVVARKAVLPIHVE
ncbi:MAG: hypothetical protein AMXMBFR84_00030 [Candidatus Hydrogenedentota bacterium]